jgi:hypothetical protein
MGNEGDEREDKPQTGAIQVDDEPGLSVDGYADVALWVDVRSAPSKGAGGAEAREEPRLRWRMGPSSWTYTARLKVPGADGTPDPDPKGT